MARIGTSDILRGLVPRFPLEMAVASLATFLGTALWFDLPHRLEDATPPVPEKVTLQAEPLPIRMFQPSEDHETSAFMEAVALSHVAPLRPQNEVDRVALDPPPAVQVMARGPAREKAKLAASGTVPQPPPRPATMKMVALPAAGALTVTPPSGGSLRPPALIPSLAVQQTPAERHGFGVPSVRETANSARVAVTGSLDSLGRSFDALIHWR
jgi:hypothetical protein